MSIKTPIKTAIRILPFRENGKTDYLIFYLDEKQYQAWKNGADPSTLEVTGFGINGHIGELESIHIELHNGVPKVIEAFE